MGHTSALQSRISLSVGATTLILEGRGMSLCVMTWPKEWRLIPLLLPEADVGVPSAATCLYHTQQFLSLHADGRDLCYVCNMQKWSGSGTEAGHINKGTGWKKQFSKVVGEHPGPGLAKGSVWTMNMIKVQKLLVWYYTLSITFSSSSSWYMSLLHFFSFKLILLWRSFSSSGQYRHSRRGLQDSISACDFQTGSRKVQFQYWATGLERKGGGGGEGIKKEHFNLKPNKQTLLF